MPFLPVLRVLGEEWKQDTLPDHHPSAHANRILAGKIMERLEGPGR